MFKYNDKVRVKSGFYEGMEGILLRIEKEALLKTDQNVYQVKLSEYDIWFFFVLFPESNLELIK